MLREAEPANRTASLPGCDREGIVDSRRKAHVEKAKDGHTGESACQPKQSAPAGDVPGAGPWGGVGASYVVYGKWMRHAASGM